MQPIKSQSDLKKKPADKKTMEYQRDKDREKVKGIFHNYETRGGGIKFPYRGYKGDQIEWYTFMDGQTYEIPLGLARHLNQNCFVYEYEPLDAETLQGINRGSGKMSVAKKRNRFGFQSLEFMELDDMNIDGRPMHEVVGVKSR